MADLPAPVGRTARTSRPSAAAATASRCPGLSSSKPSRSRASRSIASSRRTPFTLPYSATVVGGQSYVERPPIPALAGVVSSVWIQQVAPGALPYAHRNVPSGGVELLCPVGAVPRVVGPLPRPVVAVLAPGTTVIGLRFHPGAAPSVLGLPASELVDLTLHT